MQFDRFSVTLLILRPDAPQLDEKAAAALQGAHMAYLADLHEAGYLLAAGPLFDNEFRDLSILNVDPERARELKEQDPAMRRTILRQSDLVDGARGAIAFFRTSFPRSMAEAEGD